MEIHRQTCQSCSSRELKNILIRDENQTDKVFVQCNRCKALVARYIIAHQGYYHHGKGYESYLKSLNRGGHFDSAKSIQNKFEEIQEDCAAEFDEVVRVMKEEGKE